MAIERPRWALYHLVESNHSEGRPVPVRKTITCGELRSADAGRTVTLMGWVNRRRDHGDLIFIDLRDRWGVTQAVFDPEDSREAWQAAGEARNEYVLAITGEVTRRLPGKENPQLATGEIELR